MTPAAVQTRKIHLRRIRAFGAAKKSFFLCAFVVLCAAFLPQALFSQTFLVEWDRMELSAVVSLNLKEAGLVLPSGRAQAEAMLEDRYPALLRKAAFSLQADSSSTIGDLVTAGEISVQEAEALSERARRVPPALSRDLSSISARYSLSLSAISAALKRHSRPQEPPAPLVPARAKDYTGIIIIADESLPVRGRNAFAKAQPCLFPKIWDSEMNLIYERNMTETEADMALYVSRESVLASNPPGLDEKLMKRVGDNPLRIMARGVFGQSPTDLLLDREDALIILSTETNRRLLRQGKVALVLDKAALKTEIKLDQE